MSGIGYTRGSSQYAAEPSVGPAREASVPRASEGYKWEGGTLVPPPTPAPGGMTMNQLIDARMPPRSQASIDREALEVGIMMTYSRESILKARIAQLERSIAALEVGDEPSAIDPPPEWPVYSPENPMNNRQGSASSVTSFPLFGRPATALSEISFIANTIPRSSYPLDTTTIYLGMSRELTQTECDYLNGVTP